MRFFTGSEAIISATNCAFLNNEASVNGGAIYSTGATLNFVDCKISDNEASGSGGALYVSGGTVSHNWTCFYCGL